MEVKVWIEGLAVEEEVEVRGSKDLEMLVGSTTNEERCDY